MVQRLSLALVFILPAVLGAMQTGHAVTCSGALPNDMRERFELLAAEADVVALAEITGSVRVPRTLPAGVPDTNPVFTATFRPIATLQQDQPLTEFTIGPLHNMGPDCSGGPRLKPGHQVLLFLIADERYEPSYLANSVARWRIGVFGDTVLFNGPDAYFALAFENAFERAGSSRDVVQAILDVTDPPTDVRRAAMAFVDALPASPSALPPSPTPPPTLPVPATTPRPQIPPPPTAGQIRPPDTGDADLR